MEKRVFIKTVVVVEECIGKVLLPSNIFLSLKDGKIEITAVDTPNTLKDEVAAIQYSVESILDKAETLEGLHLKHSKSTLSGIHICGLYIQKEYVEKKIEANEINISQQLF